ncbi:MAG: ABC transporter permease [Gammaproteobacteria bacterium]|jgi:putative ABC transport system permease protein|nr:ABC transporter permease [Gammaproteobacteria bacterium]
MTGVPLAYIFRNLWVRKLTTALTAGGMALVVFVFAAVLMLAAGLEKTLVETGVDDNVVVIRRSAETEIQSTVDREQASLVAARPEIATARDGSPLASKETVVLVVLPKRGSENPSNVTIRGLSSTGIALRDQVRIVEGRMFRPGTSEVVAGSRIAEGFKGAGLGESITIAGKTWTVVGVFDAGGSGFASELWGDTDQMMQAFRRTAFSSVIFRLAPGTDYARLRKVLEDDQRLTVEVHRETAFYAKQSELMSSFLSVLGSILSTIFSIGAIIGAMITMYAAVANRTAEIGTLRALGFRRVNILVAFLVEALLLSLVGGLAGLGLASLLQFYTVSTMNWQTFAELSFAFSMNARVVMQSLAFALFMGLAGGFLPAVRAARLDIVDALRSV